MIISKYNRISKMIKVVIFSVLLSVCSKTLNITFNGAKYQVDKCAKYNLSVSKDLWNGGSAQICNNMTHMFLSIYLNETNRFHETSSPIKFDISTDSITIAGLLAGKHRFKSGMAENVKQWGSIIKFNEVKYRYGSNPASCDSIIYFSIHVDVENQKGKADTACVGDHQSCIIPKQRKRNWYCTVSYFATCQGEARSLNFNLNCKDDPDDERCYKYVSGNGFGYGDVQLNKLKGVTVQRWGWAQMLDSSTTETFVLNIHLGAKNNDISKGIIMGRIQYFYTTSQQAYLQFSLQPNCRASEYHIYVGNSLPVNIQSYGQYNYTGGPIFKKMLKRMPQPPISVPEILMPGQPDRIYFIAHFKAECRVPIQVNLQDNDLL